MKDIESIVKNYDIEKILKEYVNNQGRILDILTNFKNTDLLAKLYRPHELIELSSLVSSVDTIILVASKNIYIKKYELK
jgi:hypothetical protein